MTLIALGIAAMAAGLLLILVRKPYAQWSSRHTLARHRKGGDPAPEQHTPHAYAKLFLGGGAVMAAAGLILLVVGLTIR